jgi:hypothetical protein
MFRHVLLQTVSAGAFSWAAQLVWEEQAERLARERRREEARRFVVNR